VGAPTAALRMIPAAGLERSIERAGRERSQESEGKKQAETGSDHAARSPQALICSQHPLAHYYTMA